MPAARQASRSSANALAVSAMIGVRRVAALGFRGADAPRRFEAVDARHLHVHQHQVVGRAGVLRRRQASIAAAPLVAMVGRWPSLASSERASSALISLSSATRIDRPLPWHSRSRAALSVAVGRPSNASSRRRQPRRQRGRAHRLDQIAGEAGVLQRRQFVALARRDQHDALRDRARAIARAARAMASRAERVIDQQRVPARSGSIARGDVCVGDRAGPRAPARRAAAPAATLRSRPARRSAPPCRRDRARRRPSLSPAPRQRQRERGKSSPRRARSRPRCGRPCARRCAGRSRGRGRCRRTCAPAPPSACSNSRKMRSCCSGAMPMPVSRTWNDDLVRPDAGLDHDADAAAVGELDRVAGEIEQHLAQPRRRRRPPARGSRSSTSEAISSPLACARGASSSTISSTSVASANGRALEIELAGFDLGEVENLLDQRQQRVAGGLDGLGVGGLLRRQRGVEQQVGHAEDAVQRRADLVRHHGEEARLGAVGGFRLVARFGRARARPRCGR